MSDFESNKLLSVKETIAEELFENTQYPWEVLADIKGWILENGPKLSADEYEQTAENVWIAKSAKVADSASITGPVIIGKDTEIRHCAFLRGSIIVGNQCVVGNSTELKNCILFNRVQVPHYNYVGDSVLGYRAHMGAGSICSNVKSDKTEIVVKSSSELLETKLKKFGAVLGDYVEIGCGSVLNPGTVIAPHSNIYPLSSVRGYVSSNRIYKNQSEILAKEEHR
ncbi:MAG: UDP-N-acetylglucosamine pyrophosphorylase [Lachnospiraceae bacterium]